MDKPIRMIKEGFADVRPALAQIASHPELWDLIPFRKVHEGSPHRETQDIWVRYNAWSNFDGDHSKFNAEHDSSWYPSAKDLPAVREMAMDVMAFVRGERLGAVLITRMPPHSGIYPHIDGGWHAGYYEKFAIQLKGDANQSFCYEDCSLVPLAGDLYEFRNDVLHWVNNDSNEERINLIVCIHRS